jgi:hypothetical protein
MDNKSMMTNRRFLAQLIAACKIKRAVNAPALVSAAVAYFCR